MDWKLAHEFARHWFGLGTGQVVLTGKGTNVINISALNLLTRLTEGKYSGLAALSTALDDTAMVYPWLKPASDTARRQITHNVHLSYVWRQPGYWVDLPAHVTEESVQVLINHLSAVRLGPSLLTGIRNDGAESIRGGRLWWRFDELQETNADMFMIEQRQWQWFIQATAIECGAFGHVSIRDPGFVTMMKTPLPGTLFQGDQVDLRLYREAEDYVDHRTAEWHRDANPYTTEFEQTHADVSSLMENLGEVSQPIRDRFHDHFTTWDSILMPHGWRVHSTSVDMGAPVTWWTAPGAHGPTAFSRENTLRLYDGTWLSGLKELSDYGFVLDRITVACLLWWDGDVAAMIADVESGKNLTPHE